MVVGMGDLRVLRAAAAEGAGVAGGAGVAEGAGVAGGAGFAEGNGEACPVTLIAYALGSCIGLMVHDRVAQVGGLLHFMLPDSALDPERAVAHPAMFADHGIPLLFRSCYQLGAEKKRMVAYAAGGAQSIEMPNCFEIGKRNQLALRKILWRAGVILHGESLGGTLSRTVRLELATGRIGVRTGAGPEVFVSDPADRDWAAHNAAFHVAGRQQQPGERGRHR